MIQDYTAQIYSTTLEKQIKAANMQNSDATLIETLEQISREAPEAGYSLGEIRHYLHQSAFGAFLIVLAMPVSIPFLYGVPQIVAVPMLALSTQMMMGSHEPWLPQKLAERRLAKSTLRQISNGARKWFGWAERLARPRFSFLASPPAERMIGCLLMVFCASILLPLPLTNTVPGIAVAIVGFGLLAKDGLLIIPGLLLGTSWVAGLIIFGARLTEILKNVISGLIG